MAELKAGIEIERKYIIMKPSIEQLQKMENYSVSEIRQTYLISEPGVTHRVRRRRMGEVTKYYETRKTRIDKMSVIEEEGELTDGEYLERLALADPSCRTIIKTRHTFNYCGAVFEVDIYPEWSSHAILETELCDRETVVLFPDIITVVNEVTGDYRYSNAGMSREFPSPPDPCER